jgi:hypothetical protein
MTTTNKRPFMTRLRSSFNSSNNTSNNTSLVTSDAESSEEEYSNDGHITTPKRQKLPQCWGHRGVSNYLLPFTSYLCLLCHACYARCHAMLHARYHQVLPSQYGGVTFLLHRRVNILERGGDGTYLILPSGSCITY